MIIVDLQDQILDLMGPTQEFKGHMDAARDLLDPTMYPQETPLDPHRNIQERTVDLMEYMDPMGQMSPKMGV